MSSLETGMDCQTNDPINLFPIESLRFPLDSSMRIVFTGYYNGFNVEVRSADEVALLYHMGCFGKGSASRSKPRAAQNEGIPLIIRKRQHVKRNYWHKKFGCTEGQSEADKFLKELEKFSAKIVKDSKPTQKDVIDLVSSDDQSDEANHSDGNIESTIELNEKEDIVVVVPNSDSEEENYFSNFKPKCCLNKIKLQEKLILSLQEAFFLMYGLGCLQVVSLDNRLLDVQHCWDLFVNTERNFISKYIVYHYYRSKGYVVKPGIKFGGDYLLYKEGPGIAHADFIVVIRYGQDNYEWVSILGHVRMAVTTAKEIVIAEVIKPLIEPINFPRDLKEFSVQETVLNRKLPVTINDDE